MSLSTQAREPNVTRWLAPLVAAAVIGPSSVARTDSSAAPPDRAASVAALLVEADANAASPTRVRRRALRTALTMLDRLGARPQQGAADDPVREWCALAGGCPTTSYRGRVLGPAYRRGWLATGQEMQVEQLFLSGRYASVSVASVPDGAIRLDVSGPNGRTSCGAGPRNCRWMPSFTQRYTITIRNIGAQATKVYLVID
jgi:hypothetical protein